MTECQRHKVRSEGISDTLVTGMVITVQCTLQATAVHGKTLQWSKMHRGAIEGGPQYIYAGLPIRSPPPSSSKSNHTKLLLKLFIFSYCKWKVIFVLISFWIFLQMGCNTHMPAPHYHHPHQNPTISMSLYLLLQYKATLVVSACNTYNYFGLFCSWWWKLGIHPNKFKIETIKMYLCIMLGTSANLTRLAGNLSCSCESRLQLKIGFSRKMNLWLVLPSSASLYLWMDIGDWILDIEYWILNNGYWTLNIGLWILVSAGRWIFGWCCQAVHLCIYGWIHWILVIGYQISDIGYWIPDIGYWFQQEDESLAGAGKQAVHLCIYGWIIDISGYPSLPSAANWSKH